ncbi:hypothetical protein ACFL6U_27040 [Planctomycetota bacterium]
MAKTLDPMDVLRSLGSVEELKAAAEQGLGPATRPRLNTHIHLPPNFSAFESVEQAVATAADQDVTVLGVGNYYDYRVYGDFVQEAIKRGVFPLFGTEIIAIDKDFQKDGVKVNDPGNPGRVYLCGKAISSFCPPSDRAQELLHRIRQADEQRMVTMCDRMADVFVTTDVPVGLDARQVIQRVAQRHGCDASLVVLQERHIAQAFQERIFEVIPEEERAQKLAAVYCMEPQADMTNPVAVQNEMRSALMKAGRPCYVAEDFVGLDEARELIRALGGIDCYPIIADGINPLSPFEAPVDTLISNLRNLGFHMVEVITGRNAPEVLTDYVTKLRAAGLVVAAGTEHNTLDLIPMEPQCKGQVEVPENVKEIFWEGVCITAAHQFLVAQGECGYVDADGALHPDYDSAEDRIAAFKQLGAAVIESYFEKVKS